MIDFPPLVNCGKVSPNLLWARDLKVAELVGEDVTELRNFRAYTLQPPLSARLPFSYQAIPPPVRSFVAKVVGKIKMRQQHRWARFPAWPVDLSVDFWSDHFNLPAVRLHPTPVILSHDLDSREGLDNFYSDFAPIEKRYGARSANFIVPCAWPIPLEVLDDLAGDGFEIGIHGYDHSNTTPFLPYSLQRDRLAAAKTLIERYSIKGYRAPSLLRTPSLVDALSEVYAYDASFPTSGGLFPIPNNGVATARPYLIRPRMWEFPLSLPRDGSLLFLGHSPSEILQLWIKSAQLISDSGGVVVLLTHCERRFSGQPKMLKIYNEFLSYVAQNDIFRFSTFKELLTRMPEHREV